MKIEINDFGPIQKFEFDLEKDFHFIVGRNNVGKSYAITIVYLILKSFLVTEDQPNFSLYRMVGEGVVLPKEKIDLTKTSAASISISDEINSLINTLLAEGFVKNLTDSILGTFESIEALSNQFSSKPLVIKITTANFVITVGLVDKKLTITNLILTKEINLRGLQRDRGTDYTDKEISIAYNVNNEGLLAEKVARVIYTLYTKLNEEVSQQVRSIHYLPASRSGLYQALSAFGQIIAELSKSRSFLSKKIELPGISEPLSDYFLKLSNISIKKKNFEDSPLNSIAEKIENEILKGKVEFDSKTKRLNFLPDGTSLKLDLSTTSSMVSELSPIVSYLRYVLTEPIPRSRQLFQIRRELRSQEATGKPLVIIEEPEAHLHPEVQIKLTEIFALLIESGVKIIITSHSNYIFNKVNNLILSKKLPVKSIHASVLEMTSKGSVRQILPTDELGIDDKNFLDSSELLFEEKVQLINQLSKKDV
jgi:predicted ATP-dependent endonuclease of OLD family